MRRIVLMRQIWLRQKALQRAAGGPRRGGDFMLALSAILARYDLKTRFRSSANWFPRLRLVCRESASLTHDLPTNRAAAFGPLQHLAAQNPPTEGFLVYFP
jgi:hypothetical protein